MSLQSYSMRKGGESYIVGTQNETTGKYGAIEFVNHPSPADNDRHMPLFEVHPKFDTEEEAKVKLQEFINADNTYFNNLYGISVK